MGELLINGQHVCYTMEPAYAADTVKPRAIPAGTYDLDIRFSPHFNRLMPHVENVPGFTDIMIHWGNIPANTEGCLLVGELELGNFLEYSVDEFNILFQTIQDALTTEGQQVITYVDPPSGNVGSGAGGNN